GSSTRQRSSSGSAAPGENQYHGRPDSGMPWDDTDSFASQMDDLLRQGSWTGARVQEHSLEAADIRDAYVYHIAPDPEAAESALAVLRREDAGRIRLRNKARYQEYKRETHIPIIFAVYGGGTDHPVLVFDGVEVPEGAVATYEGSLQVSEKAGGFGAKAGRFFNTKGTKKFSSGTLAGTMTAITRGATPVDLPELTRLLKKSGITDKNLVQG
ncbi:hypothetical protein ABZ069_37775, partial [Streptomyces microflavus]|uniref:hypothetical protein n=1 Tax=Streptomyces microflavus TaxID=1919 RepID=UPI0033A1DD47